MVPAMIEIKVVLPHPEGPTNMVNFASWISRSMPLRAGVL